jgi:chondroitin AC lyase
MKKNNAQVNFRLMAIVFVVILISSYKKLGAAKNKETLQGGEKANKVMADQDLETIRKRILGDLLEPAIKSEQIKKIVSILQPDGSWPGINYKDTTKTGFEHRIHLENMFALAQAYKKPGSEFYGNQDVKKALSSALDFWIARDFICENWWWNEMGTPNWMINTLLVMDADLTEKQKLKEPELRAVQA